MRYLIVVRLTFPLYAFFAITIMVAMLWASTMAVTHIDNLTSQSKIVTIMDNACCSDQGNDSQNEESVPHNCCMAHCMSIKAASPVLALVRVQLYATVIHAIADGDVVPNQFLKNLFRPPRTLA